MGCLCLLSCLSDEGLEGAGMLLEDGGEGGGDEYQAGYALWGEWGCVYGQACSSSRGLTYTHMPYVVQCSRDET